MMRISGTLTDSGEPVTVKLQSDIETVVTLPPPDGSNSLRIINRATSQLFVAFGEGATIAPVDVGGIVHVGPGNGRGIVIENDPRSAEATVATCLLMPSQGEVTFQRCDIQPLTIN